MKIYNTTTRELETLTYYDRSQNASQQQDSSADITAGDPNITFDPNEGHYQASGEAIDYWRQWFDQAETADDMEREVRELLAVQGESDISGRIREEVDQHYFEEDTWPKQRMTLLTELKIKLLIV
jgi:predicted acyl esterase